MARLITELTAAGAVDGANDLLWIEQSGAPRKITPDALVTGAPPDSGFRRYTQEVLVPAGGALTEILDEDGNSFTASDVGELSVRVYVVGTGTDTGLVGAFYSDTSAWTAVTHYASGVSSNHPRIGLDGGGLPAVGHYHASAYTLAVEVIRTTNRSTFSTDEVAWRAEAANGDTAFGWGDHGVEGYAVGDLADYLPLAGGTMTGVITGDDNSLGSLTAPGSGSIIRQGSYVTVSRLYSNAAFAIACNAYSNPADTVSGQMRYTNTHGSYGHTIFEGSGGEFRWYCASGATTAGAVISKSLKMSLSAAGRLSNAERIYPGGNATGYIDGPTTRGSINVNGAQAGSYSGYSISNNLIFMYNGTAGGIYDEVQNEWKLRFDTNATGVIAYADGVDEFQTQNSDTTANTSGAQVKDHQQTYRDVGFNHVKEISFTVSDTLEDIHAGCILRKTGTGTLTLTLAADSQFPNGSMCTVLNHGTGGSLTISDGSEEMYIMDGSGTVTDNTGFVLAVAGVITIWRQGTSAYYVWGAGIP